MQANTLRVLALLVHTPKVNEPPIIQKERNETNPSNHHHTSCPGSLLHRNAKGAGAERCRQDQLAGQSENSVAILLSGYSFVSLRHETMASITDSIS